MKRLSSTFSDILLVGQDLRLLTRYSDLFLLSQINFLELRWFLTRQEPRILAASHIQ